MKDLIERQAAIEAIEKHIRTAEEPYQLTYADKVMNHAFEIAASCVYNLSATEADVPDINDGDMISRQAAIDEVINLWADKPFGNPALVEIKDCIEKLPSARPYTDEEIQKMQDIEQAQLDKAYEMGKADAMAEIIHCKDCIYRSGRYCHYRYTYGLFIAENHYCKFAQRREVSE